MYRRRMLLIDISQKVYPTPNLVPETSTLFAITVTNDRLWKKTQDLCQPTRFLLARSWLVELFSFTFAASPSPALAHRPPSVPWECVLLEIAAEADARISC